MSIQKRRVRYNDNCIPILDEKPSKAYLEGQTEDEHPNPYENGTQEYHDFNLGQKHHKIRQKFLESVFNDTPWSGQSNIIILE